MDPLKQVLRFQFGALSPASATHAGVNVSRVQAAANLIGDCRSKFLVVSVAVCFPAVDCGESESPNVLVRNSIETSLVLISFLNDCPK